MPDINLQIGKRNFRLVIEEGKEGFILLEDKGSNMALHIREEDDFLVAIHFIEGQPDPANQIDLDTGEHCWYEHAR